MGYSSINCLSLLLYTFFAKTGKKSEKYTAKTAILNFLLSLGLGTLASFVLIFDRLPIDFLVSPSGSSDLNSSLSAELTKLICDLSRKKLELCSYILLVLSVLRWMRILLASIEWRWAALWARWTDCLTCYFLSFNTCPSTSSVFILWIALRSSMRQMCLRNLLISSLSWLISR